MSDVLVGIVIGVLVRLRQLLISTIVMADWSVFF
jgi:hypothetical protein